MNPHCLLHSVQPPRLTIVPWLQLGQVCPASAPMLSAMLFPCDDARFFCSASSEVESTCSFLLPSL